MAESEKLKNFSKGDWASPWTVRKDQLVTGVTTFVTDIVTKMRSNWDNPPSPINDEEAITPEVKPRRRFKSKEWIWLERGLSEVLPNVALKSWKDFTKWKKKNEIIKSLHEVVEQIYVAWFWEQIHQSITSFKKTDDSLSVSTITLHSSDYFSLTPSSKKKVVSYKLKEKYWKMFNPNKENLDLYAPISDEQSYNSDEERIQVAKRKFIAKRIWELYRDLYRLKEYTIIGFANNNYWLDDLTYEFYKLYIEQTYKEPEEMSEFKNILYGYITDDEKDVFKKLCLEHGVSMRDIEDMFGDTPLTHKFNDTRPEIESQQADWSDSFFQIKKNSPSSMLAINPFEYQISMWATKTLWLEKFKELYYWDYFPIAKEFTQALDWNTPASYNILPFELGKLLRFNQKSKVAHSTTDEEESSVNKKVEICQHVLKWDIDSSFTDSDLENIANLVKSVFPEFHVYPSEKLQQKEFRKWYLDIFPTEWKLEYKWYFDYWHGFDCTNLLYVNQMNEESLSSESKFLSFSLSDCSQDEFIYLSTQISYYLKHKTFLDKSQFYSNLYNKYNRIRLDGETIHDISVFEEQYDSLVEKIIWPLSQEYLEKYGEHGKAEHTLLVSYPWICKSQVLYNLLTKREFIYKWKKLHFNANTLSMNVEQLKQMLVSGVDGFKSKISQMIENTRLPTLIAIEDIDTITADTWWVNQFEQMVTNLLSWEWSLPVTLVSSTNKPELFWDRMLRPDRFHNVTFYDMPLKATLIESIISTHAQKIWVEKITHNESFLSEYSKKMQWFTPSHIAGFFETVQRHKWLQEEINQDFALTKADVDKLFSGYPINTKEISTRVDQLNSWHEDWKKSNSLKQIWFNTKK